MSNHQHLARPAQPSLAPRRALCPERLACRNWEIQCSPGLGSAVALTVYHCTCAYGNSRQRQEGRQAATRQGRFPVRVRTILLALL